MRLVARKLAGPSGPAPTERGLPVDDRHARRRPRTAGCRGGSRRAPAVRGPAPISAAHAGSRSTNVASQASVRGGTRWPWRSTNVGQGLRHRRLERREPGPAEARHPVGGRRLAPEAGLELRPSAVDGGLGLSSRPRRAPGRPAARRRGPRAAAPSARRRGRRRCTSSRAPLRRSAAASSAKKRDSRCPDVEHPAHRPAARVAGRQLGHQRARRERLAVPRRSRSRACSRARWPRKPVASPMRVTSTPRSRHGRARRPPSASAASSHGAVSSSRPRRGTASAPARTTVGSARPAGGPGSRSREPVPQLVGGLGQAVGRRRAGSPARPRRSSAPSGWRSTGGSSSRSPWSRRTGTLRSPRASPGSQPADWVASVTTPAVRSPRCAPAWTATAPPKEWPIVTMRCAAVLAGQLGGGEQVDHAGVEVVGHAGSRPAAWRCPGRRTARRARGRGRAGPSRPPSAPPQAMTDPVRRRVAVPQDGEQALPGVDLEVAEPLADGDLLVAQDPEAGRARRDRPGRSRPDGVGASCSGTAGAYAAEVVGWAGAGAGGPGGYGVRRPFRPGGVAEWFRQGPAKPSTRVRFPAPPPAVSLVYVPGQRPFSMCPPVTAE